jgi:hypothetical protein
MVTRPGRAWGVRVTPQPQAVAPAFASGQLDLLHALESIKHLVDQFGADEVKRMVHLLGG